MFSIFFPVVTQTKKNVLGLFFSYSVFLATPAGYAVEWQVLVFFPNWKPRPFFKIPSMQRNCAHRKRRGGKRKAEPKDQQVSAAAVTRLVCSSASVVKHGLWGELCSLVFYFYVCFGALALSLIGQNPRELRHDPPFHWLPSRSAATSSPPPPLALNSCQLTYRGARDYSSGKLIISSFPPHCRTLHTTK